MERSSSKTASQIITLIVDGLTHRNPYKKRIEFTVSWIKHNADIYESDNAITLNNHVPTDNKSKLFTPFVTKDFNDFVKYDGIYLMPTDTYDLDAIDSLVKEGIFTTVSETKYYVEDKSFRVYSSIDLDVNLKDKDILFALNNYPYFYALTATINVDSLLGRETDQSTKLYPSKSKEHIIAEYEQLTLYSDLSLYESDKQVHMFDNKYGDQGKFLKIIMESQSKDGLPVAKSMLHGKATSNLTDLKSNVNNVLKYTKYRISQRNGSYIILPR